MTTLSKLPELTNKGKTRPHKDHDTSQTNTKHQRIWPDSDATSCVLDVASAISKQRTAKHITNRLRIEINTS